MTMPLGVHALYRAGTGETAPAPLFDEPTGLRVAAGPVGAADAPEAPFVAMIVSGAVEADGLGTIGAGEALLADAATAIRTATPDACWVTVQCSGTDGPVAGKALRPSEYPDWPDCPPPAAENLLTAAPVQHDLTLYADSARTFNAGFWDSTAFRRKTIPFPKFEVILLLGGWIEMLYDDGTRDRFEAGDAFLIVKGTRFEWLTEGMRKVWCTFSPEI